MRKLLTILLLALFLMPTTVQAAAPARALLLYSYHPAFPTFFKAINGIRDVFDANGVTLDVEFMDTKRFYEETNLENFTQLLKHKLEQLPPYDVLLVADDNGLQYAVDHRNDLFKDMPIVFFGINNANKAKRYAEEYGLTGVLESVSMEETVGLIQMLLPEMAELVVVSDATPSGKADLERFKEVMALRGDRHYAVLDISLGRWEDIPALVQQVPPGNAFLALSIFRDMDGKTLTFEEGFDILKANSRCPIFHLWEHGIGNGMAGGKIISFEEQGRRAAGLALAIIKGSDPVSLPVVEGGDANILVFDRDVLDQYDISKSSLPEGSVIINDRPGFFDQHRLIVIQAGVIILVLVVFITYLWRANRAKSAAEELAWQSERRYRKHVEGAPSGILAFDALGIILMANKAMVRISGYPQQELVGMSVFNLLADREKERGRNAMRTLLEQATLNADFELLRKNGDRIHIAFHGQVVDEGLTLGYCRDLTDEKAVRKALRDSETLFRGLLEQAGDAVIACNATGQLVFVNDAACMSLGYQREELIKLMIWDIEPAMADTKARDDLWTGHHVIAESVHKRKDGTTFPVELRVGRINVGGDDIILGIARDITERQEKQRTMSREHRSNQAQAEIIQCLTQHNATIQAVSDLVFQKAMELTDSKHAYVGILEKPDDDLVLYRASQMLVGPEYSGQGKIAFKKKDGAFHGLWGDSLNTGKPSYTNMAEMHPMAKGLPERHIPIERFMSIPCRYEDELVGQIGLANPTRPYTDEDLEVMESLARLFALAIYRERTEHDLLRARNIGI